METQNKTVQELLEELQHLKIMGSIPGVLLQIIELQQEEIELLKGNVSVMQYDIQDHNSKIERLFNPGRNYDF